MSPTTTVALTPIGNVYVAVLEYGFPSPDLSNAKYAFINSRTHPGWR